MEREAISEKGSGFGINGYGAASNPENAVITSISVSEIKLVIGSNERSRRVDVPFDSFGQIWPTSGGEMGQNCRKSGFSKLVFVRATTYEWKVRETSL